jgi:hypothetical protein
MDTMILLLTAICLLGFTTLITQGWQRNALLKRIETRLDRLAAASGAPTGLEPSNTVRELARMGDLAGAAAKYRAETGADADYAQRVMQELVKNNSRS